MAAQRKGLLSFLASKATGWRHLFGTCATSQLVRTLANGRAAERPLKLLGLKKPLACGHLNTTLPRTIAPMRTVQRWLSDFLNLFLHDSERPDRLWPLQELAAVGAGVAVLGWLAYKVT